MNKLFVELLNVTKRNILEIKRLAQIFDFFLSLCRREASM